MANVIAELKDKCAFRLAKITKLQSEIDRLQSEANGLQVAVAVLEDEENAQQQPLGLVTEPNRPRKRRKSKPKTMVQRIVDVLRTNGAEMHRKDILTALEADGLPLSGETPSKRLHTVGYYLSFNKRVFEKAGQSGEGIWKLREND